MVSPFLLVLGVSAALFLVRLLLFRSGLIFVVKRWWRLLEDCFHVYQSLKVPELSDGVRDNQLYRKVSAYLNSLSSLEDSDFTNLLAGEKANDVVLRVGANQTVEDDFLGARVFWINRDDGDSRTLELRVRRADKRRILRPYLQHIHTIADELEQRIKDLKLFVNVERRWRWVPFSHPATLETIAMEADLKSKVRSDLESFLKAKQYYHRLGRVWRRSFLLYGPSGTGKSSFVAAMANFLNYDVYDLDLAKVVDDSDLKHLLLQTKSRSMVVIEDLDRFLMERSPSSSVSLTAILNFMDGIVSSCCAEERVMVFTMNSKEQIEPALLRPGRVDVHIHFPLCDFASFRAMASNYLGVKEHKLFQQVEEVFSAGARLSAAEIGELMIANRTSPSRALKSVISALQLDGEGRVAAKISRRLTERPSSEVGDSGGNVFYREGANTVKEFKKLYGLLRMKSCKESPSFDVSVSQSPVDKKR